MLSSALLSLLVLASNSPEWERGLKHYVAREYQQALNVFEPLCRSGALSRENEGKCWGNVAEAYLHLKQVDKAIAFANKAVGMGDAASYARLGAAYLQKKLLKEAISALNRSEDRTKVRNFYGVTQNTERCFLNDDKTACVRACNEGNDHNVTLRDSACERGRAFLAARCKAGEIAGCHAYCNLKYSTEGASSFYKLLISGRLYAQCSQEKILINKRAKERAVACVNDDVDQCELSCKDDHNDPACAKARLLRLGERSDRFSKCEARDEVACVTGCEVDKNAAACSVLETLRQQRLSTWKSACAKNDSEACHDLGKTYRDGKFNRDVDKRIASDFFMAGCRLDRASSCDAARKLADPRFVVELIQRSCRKGDGNACRAEANARISSGDVDGGVRILEQRCQTDIAACLALGDGMKSIDTAVAARGYRRACDGGDSSACLNLFEGYGENGWLGEDASAADAFYERTCVDRDDDAPRISSCHTMRRSIRSDERRVPGEKGPQVFFFDGNFAALLGADLNPYRTSPSTIGSTDGDILGFGVFPNGALALQPQGSVRVALGFLDVNVGARLDTRHFIGLGVPSTAHAGPLNLLSGTAEAFAGVGANLGVLSLRVDDVVSLALAPGRVFSAEVFEDRIHTIGKGADAPAIVPMGGALHGDVTLREQNLVRAKASAAVGPLVLRLNYRFLLARVSTANAVDDFSDVTALASTLINVPRLLGPGTLGGEVARPGLFDEHRHRVKVRAAFNVEGLIELDATVFVDVKGGYERYTRGDIVPGAGQVGFEWLFAEGLTVGASAGFGSADLVNNGFSTWVGQTSFTMAFRDDGNFMLTGGALRNIVVHPVLTSLVVNAAFLSFDMRSPLSEIHVLASAGVVDLGTSFGAPALAAVAQETVLYGNASAFADFPLNISLAPTLAVRAGVELEFLDASVTASNPGRDIAVGAPIGYGRAALFTGLRF